MQTAVNQRLTNYSKVCVTININTLTPAVLLKILVKGLLIFMPADAVTVVVLLGENIKPVVMPMEQLTGIAPVVNLPVIVIPPEP